MSANIIDGKKLAAHLRAELADEVAQLRSAGCTPGLAVVLVGDDPASQIYVRHKARACAEIGIHSVIERHPADMREDKLLDCIRRLNRDSSIHGILVQLPLPAHIPAQRVIETVAPSKDVDGFHVVSAGALMIGQDGFRPCTPAGCMKLLASVGLTDLRGKHAVVIGRSNIVGKPMAMLLLAAHATVTICHSGTADLAAVVRGADVVVAAAGRPGLVTGAMLKPGAVVLDVGINRGADGKLHGDVDFDSARAVASHITPVPGGVGPMTIAMLLANTVRAARQTQNQEHAST